MLRLYNYGGTGEDNHVGKQEKTRAYTFHQSPDDSDFFTGIDRGTGSLYAGEYVFPGTILY